MEELIDAVEVAIVRQYRSVAKEGVTKTETTVGQTVVKAYKVGAVTRIDVNQKSKEK